MLRSVFLTLMATSLTTLAVAQSRNPYPSSSLGISMGWGAPYGFGIDYSHMLGKQADAGVGLGLGLGGKIGVGARYYFLPNAAVQPYAGVNLVRSGRLNGVNITSTDASGYQEETNVDISPSAIMHLRGGVRWQLSNIGLLGTLGYGAVVSGGKYTYDPNLPAPSARLRNAAELFGPGGLEISFGFSIGLGH